MRKLVVTENITLDGVIDMAVCRSDRPNVPPVAVKRATFTPSR